jgi:tyrosine-protein kinase Etk/Wzc
MISDKTIPPGGSAETIDFDKLLIILRHSWLWMLLIFVLINGVAIVYLRYTKNLYESTSDVKLEVKNEASQFGIAGVTEETDLLAGEIELVQSRLFLSGVLQRSDLDVNYYSIGRVLNDELFMNAPFEVEFRPENALYNTPIYFEETSESDFKLSTKAGAEVTGRYGQKVKIGNCELLLRRNQGFEPGYEVGYFFIIPSTDVQLNYLLSNLSVEPLNYKANTIRIAFKDNNARKAQYVLNKIDTIYLQYSYDQKNQANRQKIEWLSNELTHIERKMEGFEEYFETFTLENKTNNLDEDLSKVILHMNTIDSQRYEVTQQIIRLTQVEEGLKANNYNITLTQRPFLPEVVNKNVDALNELLVEQERLKMSYHEITFAYREKQKQVDDLKRVVVDQVREIKSEILKKLRRLDESKQRLENQFAKIPDKNTAFSKNQRFYNLNEQLYVALMKSKAEFEIVQAGSVPDFKILSPASIPSAPISPRRLMIYGAALVSSITLMAIFLGLMYAINDKITNLNEIERTLRIPILGVIPSSSFIKDKGLVVLDQPKAMVSEAIRTMRTNLDFFNIKSTHKVIAISSTISGEGKSFIASNFGSMIAFSRKRVVLVDLDMRKNKTHFPVEIEDRGKGLSTILINRNTWQECILKTIIPELDFIPSGPVPPNPAELLLNGSLEQLISELKEKYDYIIIDTPPAGLVTDGIIAMRNADLNIYIFRVNYSKKDFMGNLQRIITINKLNNMAVVLNALPSTNAYKYGYGYYHDVKETSKWKKIFNT